MSESREEWPETEEGVFEGVCDHCGETHPVKYTEDPFALEINDKEEFSNWCHPCYQNQCDEI